MTNRISDVIFRLVLIKGDTREHPNNSLENIPIALYPDLLVNHCDGDVGLLGLVRGTSLDFLMCSTLTVSSKNR